MKSTYTVTQAQPRLPALLREVSNTGGSCGITVHGEVKGYLISRERMERIVETLEILGNPDAMQAIRDYESGKSEGITLDEFEAQP